MRLLEDSGAGGAAEACRAFLMQGSGSPPRPGV